MHLQRVDLWSSSFIVDLPEKSSPSLPANRVPTERYFFKRQKRVVSKMHVRTTVLGDFFFVAEWVSLQTPT